MVNVYIILHPYVVYIVPIIFADDTSILFAHPKLINLSKNIQVIFTTLNKWLRAKQLSLNFNKTRYVHFTTKRNMTTNLEMGFNNKFVNNSSYKKFLGMTIDHMLSWKNHIELLIKKLCTACYILRNAKTYMSTSSLKMIYYAFFHLAMSYGIMFWGNLSHSSMIFRLWKKTIRIMEGCGNRVSCRNLFKKLEILTLLSQYILSLLMFVVQNKKYFFN
jgi:hypothetical protein